MATIFQENEDTTSHNLYHIHTRILYATAYNYWRGADPQQVATILYLTNITVQGIARYR